MTPFQKQFSPQLRDLLVGHARNETTITYGEAAKILEIHHRSLPSLLGYVGHECQQRGEPILTALVVNADTNECGDGLFKEFGVQDPVAERRKCAEWWGQKEDEHTEDIDRRAVQFAVTERRPEQQAFRRKVFKRYRGKCAVTGCGLVDTLDAAHLPGRDWRDGHNRSEDGVLLRADIHRLMDAGLLHLHSDGKVEIMEQAVSHYGEYAGVSWLPRAS